MDEIAYRSPVSTRNRVFPRTCFKNRPKSSSCHAERSEASPLRTSETLRFAQGDIFEKGSKRVNWRWLILLGAVLALVVTACGGTAVKPIELAPESVLPDDLRQAPPDVRDAYRFAVANQELLSAFPCYCGCGAQGHRNNLQCYIKEVKPDGTIEFERHAFL